ncbi:formyl transferase [uncultured Enterovirga sp.]|uniref:glucosamine inositolphosphorylceramide transferase family protein n=1 Tax=uncultured Enterovirga sp. TaxID=2026352 RepID=UPI0035CB6F2B
MRLELCLDQGSTRRWHVDLLERLSRQPDLVVGIRWAAPHAEPLPSCVAVLFALERIVHGLPPGSFAPVTPDDLTTHVGRGGVQPDVVLDLTGGVPSGGRRRWRLTFDGANGEVPLVASLLAGRTPVVAITDIETGAPLAEGHPGTETPDIIASAFDDVLARTTTLILAAAGAQERPIPRRKAVPAELDCGIVALSGAKSVARAALRRLRGLVSHAPHWRTGWRFVDGPGTLESGAHPADGWRNLPDDGLRFYADPFPIVVEGRTWLFVQDVEHRTGKGVISVVPFDTAGPAGSPYPVLEVATHLSYPFVFEHAGDVWMIPENAAGSVDLYRATRFPGGWVHEGRLLDGVEASDATPFRHDGRWWLSATVRDGGSPSDALHLWISESLHGPWLPHAANPVLVDVAGARPAGRVVQVGSRLVRPVQDASNGKAGAIALAEITRLDERGFAQRVTASLAPGPLWPGRSLRTLNRAGRLECVGGSGFALRIGQRPRVAASAEARAPAPVVGRTAALS